MEEQVVPRKGQESRAPWLWSEAHGCGRRHGAGWREDQADALHTVREAAASEESFGVINCSFPKVHFPGFLAANRHATRF